MRRKILINSIMLSFVISINYISASISLFFDFDDILVYLSLLVFLISLITNLRIEKKYILFIFISSLLPVFSLFQVGISNVTTNTYILYYIQNGILLLYISTNRFSISIFMKSILIIFLLLSPSMFFFTDVNFLGGEGMGLAYSILPVLLASVYTLLYTKRFKWISISLFHLLFFGSIYLTKISTRGVALSVFAFVLILIMFKYENKYGSIIRSITLVVIVTLVFFYKPLVYGLSDFINGLGLNFTFLDKIVYGIQTNTLLHGRETFYLSSIEAFLKSPIYGNGIGALNRMYNLEYDHNFILQLLNEGGIVYAVFHIILLFLGLFIILKKESIFDMKFRIILAFLFCLSVIRLSFSYVVWREQGYWIFIYYSFIGFFLLYKNHKSINLIK